MFCIIFWSYRCCYVWKYAKNLIIFKKLEWENEKFNHLKKRIMNDFNLCWKMVELLLEKGPTKILEWHEFFIKTFSGSSECHRNTLLRRSKIFLRSTLTLIILEKFMVIYNKKIDFCEFFRIFEADVRLEKFYRKIMFFSFEKII